MTIEGYRVERWDGDGPPDADEIRQRLESDGYFVIQWADQPGAVYPEHSHPEDQMHWVISGSLDLVVEGFGALTLNPGDRDFMPAGTEHSADVPGDEPVVYLIGRKVR